MFETHYSYSITFSIFMCIFLQSFLIFEKNDLSQQEMYFLIKPTHPEREKKKLFVMLTFGAKSKIKG